MFALYLGPDEFSKKQQVDALASAEQAEVVALVAPEELPLGQLLGQDLFAGKKVFILKDSIKLLNEKNLQGLINTKNKLFFFEEKIDKRIKFNKELMTDSTITVKQFPLPHGRELDAWIRQRTTELGGSIDAPTADALARALGRDGGKETKFGGKVVEVQELFTLWQADNEIKKLIAYANSGPIHMEHVAALVTRTADPDALEIINAIAEKNTSQALNFIQNFLAGESASDEKGKIIQLNALLSEQFRNVVLVLGLLQQRISDAEIAERTGWKSGRVFVIKKIASHFELKKVLETLAKLAALDEELKSTTTPPRVLLDLILVQLLA